MQDLFGEDALLMRQVNNAKFNQRLPSSPLERARILPPWAFVSVISCSTDSCFSIDRQRFCFISLYFAEYNLWAWLIGGPSWVILPVISYNRRNKNWNT